MNYIESIFSVSPKEPGMGILIAELGEIGYESFVEEENKVLAYIQEKDFNESMLKNVNILKMPGFDISHTHRLIEDQNWNEEWEKNFNPVIIAGNCSIRASFHPKPLGVQYDIIITPKMSFGTGHHETTALIVEQLLQVDLTDKTVLDMGCGTGVLAIFAAMRGAKQVDAIDNDPNCIENSLENVAANECQQIKVMLGDASLLNPAKRKYELIIANINRNILLQDLSSYFKSLANGGEILMSGFFHTDVEAIRQRAEELGLVFKNVSLKNNWAVTHFKKENP